MTSGAHACLSNDVLAEPWSSAVFETKNSTGPVVARGCGDGNIERPPPSCTCLCTMNDMNNFEAKPELSGRDRFLILY